jgi:hypothetical protein
MAFRGRRRFSVSQPEMVLAGQKYTRVIRPFSGGFEPDAETICIYDSTSTKPLA